MPGFTAARFHDHRAIYSGDVREDRDAELSRSVRPMRTPGHTPEDITTLVDTGSGLVAATHVWWSAAGPEIDPRATDNRRLAESRERLLALRPILVIPGHGAPFAP